MSQALVDAIDALLEFVDQHETLRDKSKERRRFDELDRRVYIEAYSLRLPLPARVASGLDCIGKTNLPGCRDLIGFQYLEPDDNSWKAEMQTLRALAIKAMGRESHAGHPTISSIFICYRRADSADVTGRIYDRLTARFGPRSVFRDVDSIPLSVPFASFMLDALSKAQAVLVIIGPSWLTAGEHEKRRLDDPGDHVRIEIETALRVRVSTIPITVSYASMPQPADLPESIRSLASLNGQPVRPDPDFDRDIDCLVKQLELIVS